MTLGSQGPATQDSSKPERNGRIGLAFKANTLAMATPSLSRSSDASATSAQHSNPSTMPPQSRLWLNLKNAAARFKEDIKRGVDASAAKLRNHTPVQVNFKENDTYRTHNLDALKIKMDRSCPINGANSRPGQPESPVKRGYLCGRMQKNSAQASFFEHEKSLVQGIVSGKGVFEFVSCKAHFRPDESSSTPLIGALREQWRKQKDDPHGLVLGGRFKIVSVHPENPPQLLADGIVPQAEDMHFGCSVTVEDLQHPRAAFRVIPLTQIGLEFRERYLNPKQIEQSHNILLRHQRSCVDVQPLVGNDPSSFPLIASFGGRGRAPTLITYSEIVERIDARLVMNEASLDAALIEVISQGRNARICDDLQNNRTADLIGFVHSDRQLRELKAALLTYMENKAAIEAVQRGIPSGTEQTYRPAARAFDENRFIQRQNRGNGDCLFHSLEGTEKKPSLSDAEILALRKKVSDVVGNRQDTDQSKKANAHLLSAAMQQVGQSLQSNGSMVSNADYAAFQAQPGNMAGTDEVGQWLKLPENCHKTVVILDAISGNELINVLTPSVDPRTGEVEVDITTRIFASIGAVTTLGVEEIEQAVAKAMYGNAAPNGSRVDVIPANRIVLYRTTGHFARVTGMKDRKTRVQDERRKETDLAKQRKAAANPKLDFTKLGV